MNNTIHSIPPTSYQNDVTTPIHKNATGSSIHYVAQTDLGEVGISITDSSSRLASISEIHSRLELATAEPVIRTVEDWLGLSLDLELAKSHSDIPLMVSVAIPGKSSRKIGVHLPLPYWSVSGESVSTLEGGEFELEWPVYRATLSLSKFILSDEDLSSIRKHATVLVPDSFKTAWAPQLAIQAAGGCLESQIELPQITWQPTTEFLPLTITDINESPTDGVRGEIVCNCYVSSRMCLEIKDNLSEAINTQIHELGCVLLCADRIAASGALLPVGTGVGMRLTHLSSSITELK